MLYKQVQKDMWLIVNRVMIIFNEVTTGDRVFEWIAGEHFCTN